MTQYAYTTRPITTPYGIVGGMWPEGSAPLGYTAGTFYYFNGTAMVGTFSALGAFVGEQNPGVIQYAGRDAIRFPVPSAFEALGLAILPVVLIWDALPTTTDWLDVAGLPYFTGTLWSDAGSGSGGGDAGVPSPSGGRDFLPFLYADALEHLVDFTGGSSSGVSQSVCRRSILNAYMRFMNETDWNFLYQRGRINLVAPYSTGTIAFDLTGGSSERLLTLSSGTWPTWARYGHIKINNVIYDVDQRLSDTTLALNETLCPADDIAAGTSYVLYRNTYSLPTDFKRLLPPTTEQLWNSRYVSPEQFLWLERHNRQAGSPYNWTVMQSRTRTGQFDIYLHGYPTTAETLDFVYQRTIRPLIFTGYEANDETGTVTVASGSGSVLGVGTTFKERMEGAYMRFSADTTQKPSGLGGLNPFGEQRKILSVESTTGILLDQEVDTSYGSTKFRISDPVEVPQYAWDAILRCIEWQHQSLTKATDADKYYMFYKQAYMRARESDSIADIPRAIGCQSRFTDRSWNNGLSANIE